MKAISIAYTEDSLQIEAIKAVIMAHNIKYSISKVKETESPYQSEFVSKIKKSDKEFKEGKGVKLSVTEFKDLYK